MKDYPTEAIRNVVLLGHGGTGKTSFAEAALFVSGAISRLGKVDDGTTTSDFDPDEVKRKVSINASLIPCEWDGFKINLIDAPGYADFIGDAYSALAAGDTAVIVVCAAAGVQVGTELAWDMTGERGGPRAILVNRIDRENSDFMGTLRQIQDELGKRCVAVQLPIGAQDSFAGVVDLVDLKAYMGDKGSEAEIPAEVAGDVETLRAQLLEAVAENDEDLLNKYLEDADLSPEEVRKGLAIGIASGDLVPVFAASSTKTIGVAHFLDALARFFPSPADVACKLEDGKELKADASGPLVAQVFKTTADPYVGKLTYLRVFSGTLRADSHVWNANKGVDERVGHLFDVRGKNEEPTQALVAGDIGAVAKLAATPTGSTLAKKGVKVHVTGPEPRPTPYALALKPLTQADDDKLSSALQRLVGEDPTLVIDRAVDSGQTILRGTGDTHIAVALERLARKFGVNVSTEDVQIAYRETIAKAVEAEGKLKKQSGGHGQYAVCQLRVSPAPRGEGSEFVDSIVGGAIPRNYIPAVEKGVLEAMAGGGLHGFPVVDVRVEVYEGKFHPVDSSDMAFRTAASIGLKEALAKGGSNVLEPVSLITVRVPQALQGDVMGDLSSRRGRIAGTTTLEDGRSEIQALVPDSEIRRYVADLRSLTGGRGTFTAVHDHYDVLPSHLVDKVVAEVKAAKEAKEH